jgi:hypothetical protein
MMAATRTKERAGSHEHRVFEGHRPAVSDPSTTGGQDVAGEEGASAGGSGDVSNDPRREAEELPQRGGPDRVEAAKRTPLFQARHSERYARQNLIGQYEDQTGANLVVVIDQIFPENLTYLEELLFDCEVNRPLHVLIASPGGDGETAIRMIRSMQARCTDLTMVLPDMAKSAATLMCLGANRILMGPGGDLGPVDPQFQLGGRSLASAKEIVAAVDEAEERITASPDTYPLFAGLLSDVNMLMVEQARSALSRTGALVREALDSQGGRTPEQVEQLAQALQAPLIDDPASHSAVISVDAARGFGLPAERVDPRSHEWALIWSLWTRYFTLGCFPAGPVAVYEGRRASHVMGPP